MRPCRALLAGCDLTAFRSSLAVAFQIALRRVEAAVAEQLRPDRGRFYMYLGWTHFEWCSEQPEWPSAHNLRT